MGMIYLLHFDTPFHHAKHYLGFAENSVEKRVERHQQGQGAALTKAAVAAGVKLELVRTWKGDRRLERQLKNRKNTPRLCPVCNPAVGDQTNL
jgi:predicted GIY-YIG superfamily endonuclease